MNLDFKPLVLIVNINRCSRSFGLAGGLAQLHIEWRVMEGRSHVILIGPQKEFFSDKEVEGIAQQEAPQTIIRKVKGRLGGGGGPSDSSNLWTSTTMPSTTNTDFLPMAHAELLQEEPTTEEEVRAPSSPLAATENPGN